MANDPKKIAPLKVVNPTETQQDWSIVMRELSMLADWIKRTFAVDVSGLVDNESIAVRTDEPKGIDSSKLWVKTSSPPGIGIPFSGGYRIIYEYTPNVPFIWTKGNDLLPSYLRKISDVEAGKFGLSLDIEEGYFYVILEP